MIPHNKKVIRIRTDDSISGCDDTPLEFLIKVRTKQ